VDKWTGWLKSGREEREQFVYCLSKAIKTSLLRFHWFLEAAYFND
jgi:hypothetical protein